MNNNGKQKTSNFFGSKKRRHTPLRGPAVDCYNMYGTKIALFPVAYLADIFETNEQTVKHAYDEKLYEHNGQQCAAVDIEELYAKIILDISPGNETLSAPFARMREILKSMLSMEWTVEDVSVGDE